MVLPPFFLPFLHGVDRTRPQAGEMQSPQAQRAAGVSAARANGSGSPFVIVAEGDGFVNLYFFQLFLFLIPSSLP